MTAETKIQEIQKLSEELNNTSITEQQRKKLLQVLEKSAAKTRLGAEWLWQVMFWPHQYAALRVALELDLAKYIVQHGQCTASQLAELTKADKLLIARIMRILTANDVFTELGPETYGAGNVSNHLVENPKLADGMKFMWDVCGRSVIRLPEYLAQTGHQSPVGPAGNFELAFGKGTNVFSWLGSHPDTLVHFQNLMAVQRYARSNWFDIFPVQERLINGFDEGISETLLVDIGGGRGSELEAFKEKFPNAPGKLVLEELPEVIESAPHLDELGIVRKVHDFFTSQPIKSARAYYLRSILHDWPENKCLEILENIKPALKKGYSKILINDWVLPEIGATANAASLDLNMMAIFHSMERSQSQFKAIIEKAGLEIVKIWSVPDTEGCIEVMLPER